MSPLFSPSGLVYRYVIESPDRTPQELHTIEDWIIERAYRSVPGVADDSGFGGPTMEYHVLLDPVRLYNFHIPVVQVVNALQANNANTGGGFYTQGGQFYYVRGLGLVKSTEDIGEIVVASNNGAPVRVKDIGRVEIGHAPRLGIFGFQDKNKNNDDAVEGVILMRRGEQTQNVLQGVEHKTEEINKTRRPDSSVLRPQRFGKSHHAHRGRQSSSRNDFRLDRFDFLPSERSRRDHHRTHCSAGLAFCLHFSAPNR
jgi:cobalt-zinc-cadmium resistance protein CzcA